MKGAFLLSAAAALLGSAVADDGIHRRHLHDAFHQRRNLQTGTPEQPSCGCTTKVVTYYGSPTVVPVPVTTSETTTTVHSTSYTTVTVEVTPSPTEALPTPIVTVYPTPGTYTIPETTITVTSETTVCGATTTSVPAGEHTIGGVTTVVETATTVTCPYATVKPVGETFTSVIETTTYVCPSAGTYTIAPTTTSVPTSTVLVYPTPASFTPGTYTQPAQTLTVVETSSIYVCPAGTASSSVTPTPAPPAPAVPIVPIVSSVVSSALPAPTGGASIPAPSGDKWGMTYSPFTDQGGCKNSAEVAADVALIAQMGFSAVRIYAPECNGLVNVANQARKSGLKLILGVFISETGIKGAQPQVTDIANWGKQGNWDLVELVVIGNEALFSGHCDAGSLAGFIQSTKQTLRAAGYNGDCTTTEPIQIWQDQSKGPALCDAIDVLGANIHCFFNPNVVAQDCGSFVKQSMDALKSVCPGKQVKNLETGWPSAGSPRGKAVPSVANQAIAIKSLVSEVGKDSVLFSFVNDLWKSPGIEQNWGCSNVFL